MQIALTNTLTRRKEPFVPADPARVTMYVCGPTVYSYAHIGNARPPVVFDVLFRLLRRQYGEGAVIYARNYTDIDDRIIAAANKTGEPISAITEKFARIYEEDTAALGVLKPTLTPRATTSVPAMIALIEQLLAKGAAYRVASGVYFAVAADDNYGKLSGRSQDELKAGARVEGEDDKRHPSDFALWKTSKPGEPSWDAPFGAGRPGWHIECSAMIEEVLGSPIDIHGGGVDLIFPHHENEIAQSETAHGRSLARVWMHNGFLTMDTTKMSKSLGNIITPRELLEQGWQGETIRWALLSAHYRAPLDWNDDLLRQSKAGLDRIYQTLRDVKGFAFVPWSTAERVRIEADVERDLAPFLAALCDDLNTPSALKELFTISDRLRSVQNKIVHGDAFPIYEVRRPITDLLEAGRMLGLLQQDPDDWFHQVIKPPLLEIGVRVFAPTILQEDRGEIESLVGERDAARRVKDWKRADDLRQELSRRWISVQDGPQGGQWSSALSGENFERRVVDFLESMGGAVELSPLLGDHRVDALIQRGENVTLVETKLKFPDQSKLADQATALVKSAQAAGAPISSVLIVAPNTAANNAAIVQAHLRPIAGLETRFVTINGVGEIDKDVRLAPK